jgi:hypothetical protein
MPSKGVFLVNSPNVKYTDEFIEAAYDYQITKVESDGDMLVVSSNSLSFSSSRNVTYNSDYFSKQALSGFLLF